MKYNKEITFPNTVAQNSKIGVTAMSSGLNDERGMIKLKSAIKNFTNKGFEIVETADVRKGAKLVSDNALNRTNEFLELWQRDDIPYIIVACGGEFLMETLPYLHQNKEIISSRNPKWVQGFSDVSLLNFYLTTNYNFATIHANSFSSYAMIPWDKSLETPVDFVMKKTELVQQNFNFYEKERDRSAGAECNPYRLTERVVYKNLCGNQEVKFSGTLLGGCMDVLKVLIGTQMDNTKEFCKNFEDGILWYLENCEMTVTDVKRTLWQMKQAGWFENAKGFIFGRTNAKEDIDDFSYEDALHDVLDELNVPIICDADFGHVAPQWTLINGAFAEFEYEEGKASLKQTIRR
jgi:muramoyltetrapeptide carboxypeptidase LdcA involved in peptidoglycan recycling